MAFDAKAFLTKHDEDPIAAITAIHADRFRATSAKNAVLEAFGVSLEDSENNAATAKKLAEELKAYRELGKPEDLKRSTALAVVALETLGKLEADAAKIPELLKSLPGRLETAEAELSGLKREAVVRDVADAYGLNAKVLQKLLTTDGLTLEFDASKKREIERNGKKEELTGVATISIDGKPVELNAHIASGWSDFAPSLSASAVETKPAGAVIPFGGGNNASKPPTTLEEIKAAKASSGDYSI